MDLLLEIGTEELPASAVYEGIEKIENMLPDILERSRLGLEGLRVMATPRRLAFIATGIGEKTQKETIRRKGPPVSASRNPDGSWSNAAAGFARSQGVQIDELVVENTDGGQYVFAVTDIEGRDAKEVIPALLQELVGSLRFGKSMRWGDTEERFSRPVRWLLAIMDGEIMDFEFAGVRSSNLTFGHRYLSEGTITVPSPGEYESLLRGSMVVADHNQRRNSILDSSQDLCGRAGASPIIDEQVLDEVVQLVELPGVVLGSFEDRHLELPREILVHAIEEHQRYFPLEDDNGSIRAGFLAVHNGDPACSEVIRKGHERVLAARLEDAEFFFREDSKRALADRLGDLEHVVYKSELGSMLEKSERLLKLVTRVGRELGLEPEIVKSAGRAALIAKCDLVTHMVVEFPSLQGVVGSIYAEISGEEQSAARAIREQYLPRRPGDSLPETKEGVLLSLCEKADNLASSFGLGHVPTGSEDPYALRRQSLGMLMIMIDQGLNLTVTDMVRASAGELEAEAHGFAWTRNAEDSFSEFFRARERVFFTERGYRYDLVEAVLELDWDRPLAARKRLDSLKDARERGTLARMYTAFERCFNLSRDRETGEVSGKLLSQDAELDVLGVLEDAEGRVDSALQAMDYAGAIGALELLCEPVDRLFDDVLIMAEDMDVRLNRLSLLSRIVSLYNRVADFKSLAWD